MGKKVVDSLLVSAIINSQGDVIMISEHMCEPHVKCALSEGWMIWDTDYRGAHGLQVQCVDDPERMSEEMGISVPELQNDAEAVQVMKQSYEQGSDHAIQAYRILKQHSLSEFTYWGMQHWKIRK